MAIKVLIVDDSLVYRETLGRMLSEDPAVSVIGKAVDAFDAEAKIQELRPDVITLDVEMPKMNGIDFLKKQMQIIPVRAVVVTSSPVDALDAITAGAVDFVNKPLGGMTAEFGAKLRRIVKIASIARIDAKPAKNIHANLAGITGPEKNPNRIIAIGASTGGTDAIQSVVQDLPPDTPGVVITQHMPAGFTKMFAERLNRQSKMTVVEAEDGMRVIRGRIIVAAGGLHMKALRDSDGYYVRCEAGEKVSGHCPSVDVLFRSVAACAGKDAVAAILTGMGSDGAEGMKTLRDAGAYTIGQDKESSVVYGMPMEAMKLGAVCEQASLGEIPRIILENC